MNQAWCKWAMLNLCLALALASSAHAAESVAKPAPPLSETTRLIQQLGDKNYFVRQRAEEQLARQGFDAFDALSAATSNPDLEIATRTRRLLLMVKMPSINAEAPPEARRLLANYSRQTLASRREKLTELAMLPGDNGTTALCWLIRYEKSPVLSKEAAVLLLAKHISGEAPSAEIAASARKTLGACQRPGAVWVDLWLRSIDDSKLLGEAWTRLADAEAANLTQGAKQTTPQIVTSLLRFQAARLKKLGRTAEAEAAVTRMLPFVSSDEDALLQLAYWLTNQEYWNAVLHLAEQYPHPMSDSPVLQYLVADAQFRLGKKEAAQATADRAFKLAADRTELHRIAANVLQYRGHVDWAKREYRQLIDSGQPSQEDNIRDRHQFAEMLHDLGEDLAAAELLQPVSDAIGPVISGDMALAGQTVGDLRSRMHYFYACHWRDKGDAAKYRKYLDEALAVNEADVDVLIACYRLTDAGADYHSKIVKLIKKIALRLYEDRSTRLRTEGNCNLYAWLIGNTEGNLDEALACAKRAVALKPEAGAYYDTLARVYFARGDYAAAVESQSKALELEPFSGLIQKQLSIFKKRLAEEKAKEKPPAK